MTLKGRRQGPRESERSPAPTGSMAALRGPGRLASGARPMPLSPEPCALLLFGPNAGYILPGPYLQGPGAPSPLFALGRGTCWADVGFPRPPSQHSQTREGAPWRPLLRAGGKGRRQVATSSAWRV